MALQLYSVMGSILVVNTGKRAESQRQSDVAFKFVPRTFVTTLVPNGISIWIFIGQHSQCGEEKHAAWIITHKILHRSALWRGQSSKNRKLIKTPWVQTQRLKMIDTTHHTQVYRATLYCGGLKVVFLLINNKHYNLKTLSLCLPMNNIYLFVCLYKYHILKVKLIYQQYCMFPIALFH